MKKEVKKIQPIQKRIKHTIEIVDTISEVKISPFFKEKIFQKIHAQKEIKSFKLEWFTPQLQFATLACFLILNFMAFYNINQSNYNTNINDFANLYGLSVSNDSFNLNLLK